MGERITVDWGLACEFIGRDDLEALKEKYKRPLFPLTTPSRAIMLAWRKSNFLDVR